MKPETDPAASKPAPAPAPQSQQQVDLISFDDEPDKPTTVPSGSTVDSGALVLQKFISEYGVAVELKKLAIHFDVLPRVPLRKSLSSTVGQDFNGHEFYFAKDFQSFRSPPRGPSPVETMGALVHIASNRKLIFSAGHSDGSVCIRHVDTKTGAVLGAADFVAHRHRAVALATDTITGSESVVVVSADGRGQVLVWTVFQNQQSHGNVNQQNNNSQHTFGVCRRPQRLFRCLPAKDCCVDISWNMNIVCAASNSTVAIYSIERDELVRTIDLTGLFTGEEDCREAPKSPFAFVAQPGNENVLLCSGVASTKTKVNSKAPPVAVVYAECHVRRIALSNEGNVIAHVDAVAHNSDGSNGRMAPTSLVVSMSLSGALTGLHSSDSDITFMSCPAKGDIVVVGTLSGEVLLMSTSNLQTRYSFTPHLGCRVLSSPSHVHAHAPGQHNNSAAFPSASDKLAPSESTTLAPAAILCVQLGPDPTHPAIVVVSDSNGDIFLRPLPDFIRWERNRSPSALAQFVSVPMQAVRGTIQQAQNLGAWTSEQAESIAQNARSLADDALGELKKVN